MAARCWPPARCCRSALLPAAWSRGRRATARPGRHGRSAAGGGVRVPADDRDGGGRDVPRSAAGRVHRVRRRRRQRRGIRPGRPAVPRAARRAALRRPARRARGALPRAGAHRPADRLGQPARAAAGAAARRPERAARACCSRSTWTASRTSTTCAATTSGDAVLVEVGAAAAEQPAPRRPGGPARRRRVRGADAGPAGGGASRSPSGCSAVLAGPYEQPERPVFLSVSIGLAGAGDAPRRAERCCATPTSRCATPSSAARTGSSATTPRTTSCCAGGPRWSTSCAARSTATSCGWPSSRWSRCPRCGRSGAEALLRWHHPELGNVPAGRVHPARRGVRADRRARRLGAAPGVPPAVAVARRRARRVDVGQRLAARAARPGVRAARSPRRCARTACRRSGWCWR